MEKPERGNFALPISGLLLLSVTVGGLMLFDVPLISERPAQSKGFVRDVFEQENVRARLWQDPFGPTYDVPSAANELSKETHEVETIAQRIRERAMGSSGKTTPSKKPEKPDQQNLVLMTAMVPGSSFSEDAEIRRRTRQALVSALAVEGYVASSGERIGYLNTRWKFPGILQRDAGDSKSISVRIPFEWFERDLTRPDHRRAKTEWVLVIWLDEESFRDHAMLRLNELMWNLLYATDDKKNPLTDSQTEILTKVKLRMIGPTSSSTLLELMDPGDRELIGKQIDSSGSEAPTDKDAWAKPLVLDRLEIFSPRATAPEALLARQHNRAVAQKNQADESQDTSYKIEDILHDEYGTRFVSTVVRDDVSAIAIVDELQRRGVDLVGDKDHVALISEWDTFFGRALPFAIEAAIQFRRGEESAGWTRDGTLQLMLEGDVLLPPRVHRFSYLRGLDGSTPQSEARDQNYQKDAGKKSENPWEVDVSQWERPVGTSGLDYIRRVAGKLTQLDRSLRRKGEQLKAIGVVGSDVYDKLLVLQALRTRFPNVIFFTTDLDARLLHPSRYPWCRNVVVVSGYGLELAPQLQREISPFRDSYQTSNFFACLLALDGVDTRLPEPKPMNPKIKQGSTDQAQLIAEAADRPETPTYDQEDVAQYLKPRLYEVARSGAYDITPKKDDSALHPQHSDGRPTLRSFAKLSLLILIVGLLVLPLNRNFRRFLLDRKKIKPRDRVALNYFTFLTILSIAIFGALIYLDGRSGEGEPFELFQGISIWPTEICRLFIILLSWVLFILAIISITVSTHKLEAAQMLLPDDDRSVEPSFWERWKQVRNRRILLWQRMSKPARQLIFLRPLQLCIVEWRLFMRARKEISINSWFNAQQAGRQPEIYEPVAIGPVWNRYRELGRVGNRLWRCLPLVFVYLAYGWCLALIFGKIHVPYRGPISAATDQTLMILSTLALVALTFFIVDATRLCERFIRIVAQKPTSWPATSFLKQIAEERGVPLKDLSDFIDVQVIARRTETVGKLITYPFIVLFVALVSCNGYFDNWRWPLQTLLFLGVILVYAVICAIVLRNAAEEARSKSLGRLHRKLSKAYSSKARNKDAIIAQLELMIQEIETLKRGAFAPWMQHPIVRAVLIPFGGVGTVALLEVLSKMGG